MEVTRRSLTEKVAALEDKVVGDIQSATTAVQDTVESVKCAVQDTVAAVKDTVVGVKETVSDSVSSVSEGVMHTFDVRARVSESPWLMVGGAVAAGFFTGLVVFRGRRPGGLGHLFATPVFERATYTPAVEPAAAPPRPRPPEPEPPRTPGWLDELMEMAGREAKKLGQQALSAVVEAAQRNINEGLPKLIDSALQVPAKAESCRTAQQQPANGPGRYTV